jgi:hypothetical protein
MFDFVFTCNDFLLYILLAVSFPHALLILSWLTMLGYRFMTSYKSPVANDLDGMKCCIYMSSKPLLCATVAQAKSLYRVSQNVQLQTMLKRNTRGILTYNSRVMLGLLYGILISSPVCPTPNQASS